MHGAYTGVAGDNCSSTVSRSPKKKSKEKRKEKGKNEFAWEGNECTGMRVNVGMCGFIFVRKKSTVKKKKM